MPSVRGYSYPRLAVAHNRVSLFKVGDFKPFFAPKSFRGERVRGYLYPRLAVAYNRVSLFKVGDFTPFFAPKSFRGERDELNLLR